MSNKAFYVNSIIAEWRDNWELLAVCFIFVFFFCGVQRIFKHLKLIELIRGRKRLDTSQCSEPI